VRQYIPKTFSNEENEEVGRPVTLEEVERILRTFAKDKSPSLDGWTVELFIFFFD